MTKAILFFVIALSCGWQTVAGAYILSFFTSCERLRYLILRWKMAEEFPDLERWTIFRVLREFDIKPTLRNFDIAAAAGVLLGFGFTLWF